MERSCKDCIHDELCDTLAVESGIPFVNPNTCEHFINKADFVEVKQIKAVRNDLKWWLETNTEKGVCYIPEHIIEKMIAKMDG